MRTVPIVSIDNTLTKEGEDLENVILQQAYLFLIYLISGILIGILFDIFRILRKSFKTQDFVTYLEDILFWIFTGFFLLFVLFKFSNGEIRLYSLLGLVLGSICYMLTISKFFIKVNVKIITFIKKIIYKIISIVIFPIRLLLKLLQKIFTPFTFFVINFKKIISSSNKKVKNRKKFAFKRRILESNVEK